MTDVVLVHAFPLDARMWQAQVDALRSAGHSVIVPNLPGFGGTSLPAGPMNLETVAHTVVRELDEDGVAAAHVAGLSLGGYVAMAMLRIAPERVSGLALCDTKASADAPAAIEHRLRIAAAAETDPASLGRLLRTALLPGLLAPGSAVQPLVAGWLDAAPAPAVAWYQRAMAGRPDSHAELSRFTGPAMVLWGEADAVSPESEQRSMLASLPHAHEVVIAGAGHLSALERPDQVSEALLAWLS